MWMVTSSAMSVTFFLPEQGSQTHVWTWDGSRLWSPLWAGSGTGWQLLPCGGSGDSGGRATTAAVRQAALGQAAACCGEGAQVATGQVAAEQLKVCFIFLSCSLATESHVH